MSLVLFANPIEKDSSRVMSQWFEEQGFEVEDCGRLDPQSPPDLIILRTWADLNYGAAFRAFSAAAMGEEMGVKVVNPLLSHLVMIDKKASHLAFAKSGLQYPEELTSARGEDFPMVVKPRYGAQGKGVKVVQDQQQLKAVTSTSPLEDLIVQRFVDGKTVRVVATQDQALYAYFKEGDDLVASISQGATPVRIDPIPASIADLATAAVRSVKGQVAGVDIILPSQGEPVLLEINSSFRVPVEISGSVDTICQAMLP